MNRRTYLTAAGVAAAAGIVAAVIAVRSGGDLKGSQASAPPAGSAYPSVASQAAGAFDARGQTYERLPRASRDAEAEIQRAVEQVLQETPPTAGDPAELAALAARHLALLVVPVDDGYPRMSAFWSEYEAVPTGGTFEGEAVHGAKMLRGARLDLDMISLAERDDPAMDDLLLPGTVLRAVVHGGYPRPGRSGRVADIFVPVRVKSDHAGSRPAEGVLRATYWFDTSSGRWTPNDLALRIFPGENPGPVAPMVY